MSVTDRDYTLSQIFATQVIGTAEGGANRPLFIRGIDILTGNESDFVLKYRGAERMDERTSGRELIAAFMAQSLGLKTPEPVTILEPYLLLPPDFWQRLRHIIPADWRKSGEIDLIEAHFNQILSNLETFKQEIWAKLLA